MMTLANVTAPLYSSTPVTYTTVQAAEAINFDKGNQSEEEYVKSIIDQLLKQDALEVELKTGEEEPDLMIIDLANKALKQTQNLAMFEENKTYEGYFYDDGKYTEPIEMALTNIELTNMDNPDAKKLVEEIKKEVEGKFIIKEDEAVKGNVSTIIDTYKKLASEFENYEEKDGKIIASTKESSLKDAPNADMLMQFYGEKATMFKELTIDPKAQTIQLLHKINVPEEAETTEEDPAAGIKLSPPTEITYNFKASSEKLPKLEELETLTMDDLNKLVEEKGLKTEADAASSES